MNIKTRQPGFTLAEILLALTVSALLMAAIAAAMHASLTSYKNNEQLAAVTQTARSILNRMSRDIRTAQAISYNAGLLTIIPPDSGNGISEIQYQFSGSQLAYRVTKNGVQTAYDLVGTGDDVQISSFAITDQTGQDWQGMDCIKSIAISATFTADGKSFPFNATARPRRNVIY